MAQKDIQFRLLAKDRTARRGVFETAHGAVETPAFMPVGTAGYVHSTPMRDVEESGAQVVLANTYHLSLGDRLASVKYMGGLHKFMGWNHTILTDSGGFQVFSLPERKVDEDGVTFSYEENGEKVKLTPERSMEIQRDLGADIVMAFDECVSHTATRKYVEKSLALTTAWAKRCREFSLSDHQFLFGIVQGGVFENLRQKSAKEITDIPFDGFAIGGVSVGEGFDLMSQVVRVTAPALPEDLPRYLMGVGLPEDIFEAVSLGMDMFDCVIPTRYARQGTLFTRTGKLRIKNKNFRKDRYPLDTRCSCYTCRTFSRMVLRYLFFSGDPLAETLATIHNLTFYQDLMADIRKAIEEKRFRAFREDWLSAYSRKNQGWE